jgi:2'-5' RNA ligase
MFERRSYVVVTLPEPVASRVHSVRRRFSPLRAQYPSEITVAGSGGVGPIVSDEDETVVFDALTRVAADTSPFRLSFGDVRRFDGTDLFYFSIRDAEPLLELHRRVVDCGVRFDPSPFPFTPHCTISGVALSDEQVDAVLHEEIDEPFEMATLAVYSEPLPIQRHFQAGLGI